MALITDLPTNASPATTDYMITDNGSSTSKSTIENVKGAMGFTTPFGIAQKNISANTSATYTLSSQTVALLITSGGSGASQRGAWIIGATTAPAAFATPILSATGITITTNNAVLTIANGTNGLVYSRVIIFNGSVS